MLISTKGYENKNTNLQHLIITIKPETEIYTCNTPETWNN